MSMEHAIENGPGEPAMTIEKCQCPPSYQGSSCQVQFTICAFFHAGFFFFFCRLVGGRGGVASVFQVQFTVVYVCVCVCVCVCVHMHACMCFSGTVHHLCLVSSRLLFSFCR